MKEWFYFNENDKLRNVIPSLFVQKKSLLLDYIFAVMEHDPSIQSPCDVDLLSTQWKKEDGSWNMDKLSVSDYFGTIRLENEENKSVPIDRMLSIFKK